MQIALHIGVHCTDEDQLLKCLAQNRDTLRAEGIVVPEPSRYRPVVRETLQILKDDVATPQMQEVLLDAVLDEDDASRVVLSHESFVSVPGNAIEDSHFYPNVSRKAPRLRNLFADSNVEFFVALRDPATFIPAVFERAQEPDFNTFISGSDPMTLRWSNFVSRLRAAVPEAPVTVWCNEDTPLIWPRLVRALGGVSEGVALAGVNDFLGTMMSRNAVQRLEAYLEGHPPQTEAQRQRIVAAFLDKFAKADVMEQEIDLPGWTNAYVDTLSQLYDEDVAQISQIPGVTFIAP